MYGEEWRYLGGEVRSDVATCEYREELRVEFSTVIGVVGPIWLCLRINSDRSLFSQTYN